MALTPQQLAAWRRDADHGNHWRYDAGIDEDYYDGNQYDDETARKMQEAGMPLTVVPISRDMVATVVGLQERSQTDWIVRPESSDDYQDLSRVLSLKLKEAEAKTKADRACLDACSSQNKAGIGWVEVGRGEGLLDYPYRVQTVPWREIWWDSRSKASDITSDSEYLRRIKFYEKGVVKAMFPGQVHAIEAAGPGNDMLAGWYEPEQYVRDNGIRDMTQVSLDLYGGGRELVALEEFYYKTREKGWAIRGPDGRWLRFDENNPRHMAAYNAGMVTPKRTAVTKMNRAVYVGNFALLDGPSPYPHDDFPYVAMVYDREARTGVPYGLIRTIRSLQDEVNTRRARMMWGLNFRQVKYDSDAVEDPELLREEVNRPDGMIELNADRRERSILEISTDYQLNSQQFQAYQDALNLMPQVGGVPRTLSGQKERGVDSGVAMEALIDQGVNSQGRANSMYREGRSRVGQLLLSLVIEDIGTHPQMLSARGEDGKRVQVRVNEPTRHPNGYEYVKNNVQQIQLAVTLDDVPSSPTFRRQQFEEIARVAQGLGSDEVKAMVLPMLIEASDLPNKRDMAKALKQRLGMDEPETQEEMQAMQARQQEERRAKAILEREKVVEIAEKQAKAVLDQERAKAEAAKTSKTAAEIDKILTEIAEAQQDMQHQQEAIEQQGEVEVEARLIW